MGQRISFFKILSEVDLKTLIFNNYSSFRQWYLDIDKSSIEEFNHPFGNAELKDFLRHNLDLRANLNDAGKNIVDELTSAFVGNYCDLTDHDSKLLKLFGPCMNKRRYVDSTQMVLKTKDEEFIRLWKVIITGRSLQSDIGFDSFTNDYVIGWLTVSECKTLKSCVETHFGNIQQIRDLCLPKIGQEAGQEQLSNSHNRRHDSSITADYSGFEYVLLALVEIAQQEVELIIAIENS